MKTAKLKTASLTALIVASFAFMIIGFSALSVNAADQPAISGVSLSLSEDMTVKFYAENLTAQDATVRFTYGDKVSEVTSEVDGGKAVFAFTGVYPQYMSRTIIAELFDGTETQGDPVAVKSTSVTEYVRKILDGKANLSCEKKDALKALVVAAAEYGSEVKKYAADNGIENVEDADPANVIKYGDYNLVQDLDAVTETDLSMTNTSELSWANAGLLFRNKAYLYFEFLTTAEGELSATVNDSAVNVSSATITLTKGSSSKEVSGYRIEYPLNVTDIDTVLTAEVFCDATKIGNEIKYSVKSFLLAAQNDETVGALAKSFYNYGVYAKAYVNASDTHSYKVAQYDEDTAEYSVTDDSFDLFRADGTTNEDQYGNWLYCEHCGTYTWYQGSVAVNGSGTKHWSTESGRARYVLKSGATDLQDANSYTTASDGSYTLWDCCYYSGTKNYTYTFIAPKSGYVNVILSLWNLNESGSYTLARPINETFSLYRNSYSAANQIEISDNVVFNVVPKINNSFRAVFFEYTVANVYVEAGSNTFVVRYDTSKTTTANKGGYFEYLRTEYTEYVCNEESYKTIPEYGTDYTSAEATLGSWQVCDDCGERSYTVYATAAENSSTAIGGNNYNTKTTSNGPTEYVLKSGYSDSASYSNYQSTGRKVNLSSTTYNLQQNRKVGDSISYDYTVNTETSALVKVIVRMRNTNMSGGHNAPYQLNKTLSVNVNGKSVDIPDSVVLKIAPEITGGAVFYEYELGVAKLVKGENAVSFKFTWADSDSSGKPSGGYVQYFRFVEEKTCTDHHALTTVSAVRPSCTAEGSEAHSVCSICGKIFDPDTKEEADLSDFVIEKIAHVAAPVPSDNGNGTHSFKCVDCGTVLSTEAHVHNDGERHVVIGKKPNKVWYIAGETLADTWGSGTVGTANEEYHSMELFVSDTCALGCTDITRVTDYEVVYDNGGKRDATEAFVAGDTAVTLKVAHDDAEYVGILDGLMVFESADQLQTIDDKSFTLTGQAKRRTNNTGYPGQSGYGGSYVTTDTYDSTITATFTATTAKGRIYMQAASNNVAANYAGAQRLNRIMDVYVNGVKVDISDEVVLDNTVVNEQGNANRWQWTKWCTIDLGEFELNENSTNTIRVVCKSGAGYYLNYCGEIDCFNVAYGE